MASKESPDMRVLEVLIPADLANWLDTMVSTMEFASQSHGVARALFVYKEMPVEMRATRY